MEPEYTVSSGFACYGQGFSRQRGLIHFDRVAGQQFGVCRHDVADAQPYHVAGDQLAGRDRAPGAVSLDLRPQCQLFLERGDGIAGLVLLPKPNDGVGHQKRKNDPEIRPMTDDRREDRSDFDHPGNRSPQIREELQQGIDFFLGQLVVAILGQPALPLFGTQPRWRASKLLPQFGDSGRRQI